MREIRIPGIRRVLRISWSAAAAGRDADEEIRFHLDARAEELMRHGVPEGDARAQAQAEYGNVDESRRELAQVDRRRMARERYTEFLMSMRDDLKFAARSLARRPAMLVATIATLSLGISANAIMFGVVDQLLLRAPAHIAAPEQVKRIYYSDMMKGRPSIGSGTTYTVLPALRANAPGFSELAGFDRGRDFSIGRGRDAQNAAVQLVSGNYFRLLGVRLALGRPFTDDDDRLPIGQPVAIVSDGFWRSYFGGDREAIGRTLLVQGKSFTVVGVAPRGFSGVDRRKVDMWLPISSIAAEVVGQGWYNTTNNWWIQIIGRVRDGVTPNVAAEQATAAYRGLVRQWNGSQRDSTSSIVLSSVIGARTPNGLESEAKVSLWLIGVAVVVLLIACANVANILIARTLDRRREIAVRLALGVSRGRLVRMLLTESALLASIAAVIALGVAFAASRMVQNVLLPSIVWSDSVLDARIFGLTAGIAVLCTLLAGLGSAVQGVRTDSAAGLKASARQVAAGNGGIRFALLLAQTALSVILLIGAGLFVRSLRNVVTREVGIDRDQVMRVTMPLERFGFDATQVEEIYRRGVERLRAVPGVAGVAVARLTVPMQTASASNFAVPGVKDPKFAHGGPYNAAVTSGFFATVGAPIIRGRDFTLADEQSRARVLIVNEALAKAYWPNVDPIGRCAKFGSDTACSEIIGVARTVLQFRIINDDRAIVYAPPSHPGVEDAPPRAMLVRISGNPAAIIPIVQRELQALASTMPFVQVTSYGDLVRPQLQPWRLGATMFTLFGVVALIIAAVGLYGVMAYWVSQRSHEIGIRMALGARRVDVLRLVAWESSRAVVAGVVLGGGVAFVASRWIASMLYDTSPHDPVVYGTAAVILAVAGALATIVPARRSSGVDPATAIRSD